MKKILFISYSHDSEDHMAWVKKFADDLETIGGFEVLLDQNLPKGFSLIRFMEYGLSHADKVLIIGTPQYKEKSETGKGAALEGTIISTELMNNIDTLKFYPILRSGTFTTSFPPVLQGRLGDDLSNDDNYEEKLQIVVDSILNEKPLPAALTNGSLKEQLNNTLVANVDLSQGVLFETYFGKPTGKIEGVALTIEVTNRRNEIRYFNQPMFQTSIPIKGTADSFTMLNAIYPISFPVKLEFGQQYSIAYKLVPANIKMFASLLEKDNKATIKAIVTTTLNEKCESEPLDITEIVHNSKYVK